MDWWQVVQYGKAPEKKKKKKEYKYEYPEPKHTWQPGADAWQRAQYHNEYTEQNIKDADIRGGLWHSLNYHTFIPNDPRWVDKYITPFKGKYKKGGSDYWFDAKYNPDGTLNYTKTNKEIEKILKQKEKELGMQGKSFEYTKSKKKTVPDKTKSKRSAFDRVIDLLQVGQYIPLGGVYEATNKDFKLDPSTQIGKKYIEKGVKSENVNKIVRFVQGAQKGAKGANPFGEDYTEGEYTTSDILENAGWNKISEDRRLPYKSQNLNWLRMKRKELAKSYDRKDYEKKHNVNRFWDKNWKPPKEKTGRAREEEKSKHRARFNPFRINPTNVLRGGVGLGGDIFLDLGNWVTLGGKEFVEGTGRTAKHAKTIDDFTPTELSKIGRELYGKGAETGAKDIARRVEKLQNIKKGGRGISFGPENLPFIGNTKFAKDATHTFVEADKIREFSDKIGLGRASSTLSDAVRFSKLGRLFNTKADLQKLARENPEEAMKVLRVMDMMKGVDEEQIVKELIKPREYAERFKNLSEKEREQIFHLIDDPQKAKRMFFEDDFIKEYADKDKVIEARKKYEEALKGFTRDSTKSWTGTKSSESKEVKKVLDAMDEYENAYKKYKELANADETKIGNIKSKYNELWDDVLSKYKTDKVGKYSVPKGEQYKIKMSLNPEEFKNKRVSIKDFEKTHGFYNEVSKNKAKLHGIDVKDLNHFSHKEKVDLLNDTLFGGKKVISETVYQGQVNELLKKAINPNIPPEDVSMYIKNKRYVLDSRASDVYSHLADKFQYDKVSDYTKKIKMLEKQMNKRPLKSYEMESYYNLQRILGDRKYLRDKLFNMSDKEFKRYLTDSANKNIDELLETLRLDASEVKRYSFVRDLAEDVEKTKLNSPIDVSKIRDDLAKSYFDKSYKELVSASQSSKALKADEVKKSFIDSEVRRKVSDIKKKYGSTVKFFKDNNEYKEEILSNLSSDKERALTDWLLKKGYEINEAPIKEINIALKEIESTPTVREILAGVNEQATTTSRIDSSAWKKFNEYRKSLGMKEGQRIDEIIDQFKTSGPAKEEMLKLRKNYKEISEQFSKLPDDIVRSKTKNEVLKDLVPINTKNKISKYIQDNLIPYNGKYYDNITGEILEELPDKDSNIKRFLDRLEREGFVDELIGKKYRILEDDLGIEVTKEMIDSGKKASKAKRAWEMADLRFKAVKDKELRLLLLESKYGDVNNYVKGEKVSDEVINVAKDVYKELFDVANEKKMYGLGYDVNDKVRISLPHLLTDEGLEASEDIQKEALKMLRRNKDMSTEEAYKKFGYIVSNKKGVKPLGERISSTNLFKNEIPVETVNEYMRKKHGIKKFFKDDIAEAYFVKMLDHDRLMYEGKTASELFKISEQIRELDDYHSFVKKGNNKAVINAETLRKLFQNDIQSNASRKKYLKKLGIKPKQVEGAVTPFIEIKGYDAIKYALDNSIPIRALNGTLVDEVNKVAIKQQVRDSNVLLKLHDKALHLWKLNATTVSPGFHVRNKFGNLFNNYLAVGQEALSPENHKTAYDILSGKSGTFVTNGGKKIDYSKIRKYMEKQGILDSGYFTEEMRKNLNKETLFQLGDVSLNPFNSEKFLPYKLGSKFGGIIEEQDKIINYISNLKLDKSFSESAEMVNKFLFDYSDLTIFEQNVARRIVPFYTWMRKNIPLQLEMLTEQPEVYRNLGKVIRNIEGQVDEEDRIDKDYVADYAKDWVQLPGSFTNERGEKEAIMLNPNLPYDDLGALGSFSDGKELVSGLATKLNPFIKTPIELGLNKNLYFDNEIEKYPGQLVDAPSYMNPISYMKGKPKQVSPKVKHIANQVAVLQSVDKYSRTSGLDRKLHFLNRVSGVKVSSYDHQKDKHYKMRDRLDELHKIDNYDEWKHYAMKKRLRELERMEEDKRKRRKRKKVGFFY